MKFIAVFISTLTLLFTLISVNAQSLPIDFETDISTSDFIDFDGGTATVIENPYSSGINTSTKVAKIIRNGGEIWSGSKIALSTNLDFNDNNTISMKVYSSAPIGTTVKFKLEGNGTTERDVQTTVTNEWEVLSFDFTGEPSNFKEVVFMFDFGNVGDGSDNSTFFFDDVEQFSTGSHIDLPVDFENSDVNYTMSDFGGNISSLVTDPTNSNNKVIKAIKTDEAATWAGTTIGTPAGFLTNIPITLADSKMYVKVWSPEAGTPIRLKIEDSDDPTHTCETETNTTVSEAWEVLEFDFTNQAPGTELLSVGLSMGWTYNMASIFFNFGTEGSEAGETTYYFDNVLFGDMVIGTSAPEVLNLNVSPNPSNGIWTISSKDKMKSIKIYDLQGKLVLSLNPDHITSTIDGYKLVNGMYIAIISTEDANSTIQLIKQ